MSYEELEARYEELCKQSLLAAREAGRLGRILRDTPNDVAALAAYPAAEARDRALERATNDAFEAMEAF